MGDVARYDQLKVFEEEVKNNFDILMHRSMQQMKVDNRKLQQPRTRLDVVDEEDV